jgi:hypothetical protein
LSHARALGLFKLSNSGYGGAKQLDRKLDACRTEGELPDNSISGLADFGVLYENALRMRILPLDVRSVLFILLAAVLPFAPLIFLAMPADEVLRALKDLML